MAEEKYHDRSFEDRERENREYVESQAPVKREEPRVLNPDGGNVPEPENQNGSETSSSRRAAGGDVDYDSWTVEDLRAEAGDLEVKRGDGGEGAPLKADYVKALRKRDRR